jgi:hypothetical protein
VQQFINKYLHKRYGNNNTPRFKVLTKVIQVKPLSSFTNPGEFYI